MRCWVRLEMARWEGYMVMRCFDTGFCYLGRPSPVSASCVWVESQVGRGGVLWRLLAARWHSAVRRCVMQSRWLRFHNRTAGAFGSKLAACVNPSAAPQNPSREPAKQASDPKVSP